jgi:PAS domain S-box-containing protein
MSVTELFLSAADMEDPVLHPEGMIAMLAAIVQSSDDAIISKTLNGIVTSWNAAAERIFGHTAAEMVGQSILTIIPPDRHQEEPAILERIRRGERVEHFETKRITKDGRLLDISLTISPVRDKTGKVIGVSKIARNITDQKQAQRLIREREELFRMAVASTHLGSWEYYPQSDQFIFSEESRRIWGLPMDQPITTGLLGELIHLEDQEIVLTHVRASLKSDESDDYQLVFRIFRLSDKTQRWIRCQWKRFFLTSAQTNRYIGTMLDITEEKAAKEELERQVAERTKALLQINARLEKSNNALEQFAYIASHDLQEPLRKIQTFAELVQENMNNPEASERYFGKITVSAEKMSRLINDVLNYSRLSRFDKFTAIDLNVVLKDVLSEFDLLIEQKQATVKVGPMPAIQAIEGQLNQLFRNLLGNSLKFNEGAPVARITATMAAFDELPETLQGQPCQYVRIILEDNGIGFEQRYAEQIFHIFKRLNVNEQYPGTGIGLALCKKIVENHQGMITAEGQPGCGAKFTIWLPLEQTTTK